VEGIFIVVAGVIIYLRHASGAIAPRFPIAAELAIGLLLGAASGVLVGTGLLRSRLGEPVVRSLLPLQAVTSAMWSIVVISLLAGVGEELLFRAALQPWIGILWASILFGLAHGGTARLNEGLSGGRITYVFSTVVAGILLGLLYQSVGLAASTSAHAAFDAAILLVLAPVIAKAVGTRTAAPA